MWDSSKGQRRCDVYAPCLLRRWGARGWWIGLANRMMEKRRDLEVGDYGGGVGGEEMGRTRRCCLWRVGWDGLGGGEEVGGERSGCDCKRASWI